VQGRVGDGGGQFLDEGSGGGERALGFGAGVIQVAEGEVNPPQERAEAVRLGALPGGEQRRFRFIVPAQNGQRFTSQF